MAQPSLALAWLNAVHLISQSSLSEWRSHHLELSLFLFSFSMWVSEIILTPEKTLHVHTRAHMPVHIFIVLRRMVWVWLRGCISMVVAIRAFKGEGWMDHYSCGVLMDRASIEGPYKVQTVMTKLWDWHWSFHTTCSIWMDINSIKQITRDSGDEYLSGLVWRQGIFLTLMRSGKQYFLSKYAVLTKMIVLCT